MDNIKLALKFVELPQWRWLPGMRTVSGDRVIAVYNGGNTVYIDSIESAEEAGTPYPLFPIELDVIPSAPTRGRHVGRDYSFRQLEYDQLPDLSDPATIGCLCSLLRLAYRDGTLVVYKEHVGWSVDSEMDVFPRGTTEAEAIYLAIDLLNK